MKYLWTEDTGAGLHFWKLGLRILSGYARINRESVKHRRRDKMKVGTIIESFSVGVRIVLVIGIVLAVIGSGYGITSLMPEKDFDYLLDNEPEKGMHIKGKVLYTYDCFASEETYTQNSNGSRTPSKTSHYYYAVPTSNGVIALEVPTTAYKSMEALLDETVDYMMGGAEPSTEVLVDGGVRQMSNDMRGLMVEYLEDVGYTKEEISDMEPLLVIKQPGSMSQMRIIFLVGVALTLLGIVWLVINCVRNSKDEAV